MFRISNSQGCRTSNGGNGGFTSPVGFAIHFVKCLLSMFARH